MRSSLSSGVASARKSSTPASASDRRGRQRVVPGDHHRANAHRGAARRTVPRCRALTMSFRWMVPRIVWFSATRRVCRHCERSPRLLGHGFGHHAIAGVAAAPLRDGVARTLADAVLVVVDTAHARLCREGNEGPLSASTSRPRSAEPPRQRHDRASLGRLVGATGQVRGSASCSIVTPGAGRNSVA